MEKFPDRRSPSRNRTRRRKIYFSCHSLRFYKSVISLNGADNDDHGTILIRPELHSKLILNLTNSCAVLAGCPALDWTSNRIGEPSPAARAEENARPHGLFCK
jgi:hypothetical protein